MAHSYLEHHGIKGQKWGVRRYQNENGTLTRAGRERYSDSGKGSKLVSMNGVITADTIEKAYPAYKNQATKYFNVKQYKLNNIAAKLNYPPIADLSGSRGQRAWNEAYLKAAQDMANDQLTENDVLLIMGAYYEMENLGLTGDFTLSFEGDGKNTKAIITHKVTRKKFSSIPSAYAFYKRLTLSATQRQKNVQGEPVRIKKRGKGLNSSKPNQDIPKTVIQDLKRTSNKKRVENAVSKVSSVSMKSVGKSLEKQLKRK